MRRWRPRARGGGLTSLVSRPYLEAVIRLFLAALCVIGLALAPTAGLATPSAMPGCTMEGHMPAKPADHSKMDCCTPACQISAAAALLPERVADAAPLKSNGALHGSAPAKELASFTASGLDPPPRLPS